MRCIAKTLSVTRALLSVSQADSCSENRSAIRCNQCKLTGLVYTGGRGIKEARDEEGSGRSHCIGRTSRALRMLSFFCVLGGLNLPFETQSSSSSREAGKAANCRAAAMQATDTSCYAVTLDTQIKQRSQSFPSVRTPLSRPLSDIRSCDTTLRKDAM